MRKLLAVFVVSIILIAAIVVFTFFYIAFTGHSSYCYDVYVGGCLDNVVKVDKYVTADKIIFKSRSDFIHSLDYSMEKVELFLGRKTLMPLKYVRNSLGARGIQRSILIKQQYDMTDLLYWDYPVFFDLQDFSTGEKTSVFSPDDLCSYMALMQRYNFWKKGSQYFEIMIPLDAPFPVLRDKIEVRYLENAYVPVRGKRIEAEKFVLKSKGIPEILITLSKNSHILLTVSMASRDLNVSMTGASKNFGNLFHPLIFKPEERVFIESDGMNKKEYFQAREEHEAMEKSYFFESSGNLLLESSLWLPEGEGPFPVFYYLFDNGPLMRGEEEMLFGIADELVANGIAVFAFNMPGRGKSQGNFFDLNDEEMIKHISAGFEFLKGLKKIDAENIFIGGFKDGGLLAVKAAEEIPVKSYIVLGVPDTSIRKYYGNAGDVINRFLFSRGLGEFDKEYIKRIAKITEEQCESVLSTDNNYLFFMRKKIPATPYREYLNRDFFEGVRGLDKPGLIIFGQDDENLSKMFNDNVKKVSSQDNEIKAVVLRKVGKYMVTSGSGEDRKIRYTPNGEVVNSIVNWIRAKSYKPVLPEQPVPTE